MCGREVAGKGPGRRNVGREADQMKNGNVMAGRIG